MRQTLLDENKRKEEYKANIPPVKNGDASHLLEMRKNLTAIKNKITTDKISKDPVNGIIELQSREGRRSAGSLRKTIHPTKLSASAENRAKEQAEFLLGGKNTPSLDVKDFDAFNPLLKNVDRSSELASDFGFESDADFEDSDIRRAENEKTREFTSTEVNARFLSGSTEEEKDRLIDGLGINPGSDVGALIKECIPCGRRSLSLDDIEFSNPFAQTLEDLKNKLKQMQSLLGALTLGNQFEEDLCDLLKLWESQCIPDLFGIISLLGILMAKYTGGLDLSLKGALNSLIAPLLSPIIGPFVHNLERYIDLIVDPLECVVDALEAQMYKLDGVGAINKVQAQKRAFNRKKMEFYDRKIAALQRRKDTIEKELVNNDSNNTRNFPRYKTNVPFTENEADLTPLLPSGIRQSYEKELEVIGNDILSAQRQKATLGQENKGINNTDGGAYGTYYRGAQGTLNESREAIENAGNALKSIIFQVTGGINQGIQVVRDTLEMYRLELERTLTGRLQTQEDQIELTRSLQQIQRWISIVNAIIKLKKNGWSLEEMCNRGSNNSAMGAFVGAFKTEPNNGNFNFYSGTDNNGNDLMVVAPGGARVEVTSVDFDEVGDEDLFGDVQIDEVQKTATFNDLNEADELNRKGILPDLGNLTDKQITIKLDDATGEESELDLRAQNSYVIIKNDFCSKSPIKGSSSTVRQWAENL